MKAYLIRLAIGIALFVILWEGYVARSAHIG